MQTTTLMKHALRNLLRSRRRTLSTLCAIVVGAIGILLFAGYNQSIKYSLQTTFVRDKGHLQIQQRDYLLHGTSNPALYSIHNYQQIVDILIRDPVLKKMIAVTTPVLSMTGLAGHYAVGTSRPVLIYGTEAVGQAQLDKWDEYQIGADLIDRKPLTGTQPEAALIGRGLARLLLLCDFVKDQPCAPPPPRESSANALPDDLLELSQSARDIRPPATGSNIELLAASAAGAPNIVRVNVLGTQPQQARELDDTVVSLHLRQAQQLLFGQEMPGVTAILLQLHSTNEMEAARTRLQKLFANKLSGEPLAVYDFTQLQPLYNQVLAMFGKIFSFLLALILCIALFTVGNTMNMAVMERTVEIGTLRAVGLKRGDIQRLFLSEGALLGAIGAASGVLIALALAWLINRSGMTWQPPGVTTPLPIRIIIWGEWRMLASVTGTLLLVTVLSSWWPARRASRVSIVEALRHI
ncbi:ABC transporter permease [Kosakonia sp. SMBL-WEM22]|uniref:ABC transporter permease n=1 Tax=Kosakonia sp. SMBL-WEM22 TaxID=2725560 RepID=UPI001658CFA8|nr:FtsX-like permease family protein [Kosakonia sp. SMBL-WEM22]QNQ19261.1 ABC transporter permease [Kosakonia sp. SMBL-WEM22]